jgi:hypothetical protein
MTLKETSEKIISSMTEQLKNEIKKEGCVNFEDIIEFLKHLETFFSITKNHTEEEIESFLDNLVKMYKNKIKAKDLTEERVRIFNDSINFVIMALGYVPIDLKGNDLTKAEFQIWKDEIWEKHSIEKSTELQEWSERKIEEY